MTREDPVDVMAVIVSSFKNFRCTSRQLRAIFRNLGFDSLDYTHTIYHLEYLQWGEESEDELYLLPFGQAQAFVMRMRRPDLRDQADDLVERIELFPKEDIPDYWNF